MCQTNKNQTGFAHLGSPNQIWAISAVHSDYERLQKLHKALYSRIKPGDKIVYLGNYAGYQDYGVDAIDEILAFRRSLLCISGVMPKDIIYLRGAQEEMLTKLLQLHFAPNPSDVLLWMLGHGMSQTLASYGVSPHDGIEACRSGAVGLSRWTSRIRTNIRKHPGHEMFTSHLSRAALTDIDIRYPMLFVHAGIDNMRSLEDQGDRLWWGHKDFANIHDPYKPFQKVVRGYDPSHSGVHLNCVTATLDGGCGFGGSLICAGFQGDGEISEILEA